MDPSVSLNRLSTSVAQLSVRVAKFAEDVSDARQDMDALSEEITSLEVCLETLEEDFENSAVPYSEKQKKNLKKMIDDCDRIAKEMISLLTSLAPGNDGRPSSWVGFPKTQMAKLHDALEADRSAIAIVVGMKQPSHAEQDRLGRIADSSADTESMLSVRQSLLDTALVPYAVEDPYAKPKDPSEDPLVERSGAEPMATTISQIPTNSDQPNRDRTSIRSDTTLSNEALVDLLKAHQGSSRAKPDQGQHPVQMNWNPVHAAFEPQIDLPENSTLEQQRAPQRRNDSQSLDDWTNSQLIVAPAERSGEDKEVVPLSSSSENTVVPASGLSAREATSVPFVDGKLDQIAITAAAKARNRLTDSEQRKVDQELLKRVKDGAEMSKIVSLLDRGADPNASGPRNTVLTTEIQYSGREQVIELLLSRGAEPNATSEGIPKHKIIEGGNMERLRSKLGAGRSIDAVPYRVGILFLAALHTNIEIVKLLVRYGASLRPYTGYTAGQQRSFSPDSGPSPDGRNSSGSQPGSHKSAILIAAQNDKWDIVHFLALQGADPNDTEVKSGTTLQLATASNKKELMQLLIDRGADVNIQGGRYGAALIAAAYEGHPTAAKILLDAGADINVQSRKFGTALNAAVLNGYLNVVKFLLERGADPKICYVLDTALQRLKDDPENSNRRSIVRALEARGAKPGPVDKKIAEFPGLFSETY